LKRIKHGFANRAHSTYLDADAQARYRSLSATR
jgi:hypothetical protein